MRIQQITKQSAFSLIEVLIALLILAIGMLALAASEIMGQRGTHSALKRSHATTLVNDLAERMHANPTGNYIKTLSRTIDQNDCPLANVPVCSTAKSTNENTVQKCTADEMAVYDLDIWFCGNSSFRGGAVTLLGGAEMDNDLSTGLDVTATISCPDATGTPPRCPLSSAYSISISWQERDPNREQNVTNQAHGSVGGGSVQIVTVP
jgi:type IV pilus modification protein PilV